MSLFYIILPHFDEIDPMAHKFPHCFRRKSFLFGLMSHLHCTCTTHAYFRYSFISADSSAGLGSADRSAC
jgi:hypothetical protein